MEFKEIKKKSISELDKILLEYRDKLRDFRFKDANKQLKNVREIREVRKVIAQVLMLLNKQRIEKIPAKVKPPVQADTSAKPGKRK